MLQLLSRHIPSAPSCSLDELVVNFIVLFLLTSSFSSRMLLSLPLFLFLSLLLWFSSFMSQTCSLIIQKQESSEFRIDFFGLSGAASLFYFQKVICHLLCFFGFNCFFRELVCVISFRLQVFMCYRSNTCIVCISCSWQFSRQFQKFCWLQGQLQILLQQR